MKGRIVAGMVLLSMVSVAGQSTRRQAGELRRALRQVVEKIEELHKSQIAVLKDQKKVVMTLPPPNVAYGWNWPSPKKVQISIDTREEIMPEAIEEMRDQIEEYTALELPGLAETIRGVHRSEKRSLKAGEKVLEALRKLAVAHMEQKKAAEEQAAKDRAAGVKTPEEIRAELSKRIDELDQIHQKVITVLEAVEAAQTDQWQKSYAAGRGRRAQGIRKSDVRLRRLGLKNATDQNLDQVARSIALSKRNALGELAAAEAKLKAAKAAKQESTAQ